jgi:hypothetical protein
LYTLKHRDNEQRAVEAAYRSRQPLPPAFKNAPELRLGSQFAFDAFFELSTCRQVGFAPGPIPWRDIIEYGSFHGLERDSLADLIVLIRTMDKAYLEHVAAQSPKKEK